MRKEKVSVHMRGLFAGRRIGSLTRLHGDSGARNRGASSLKYLRLLKRWLSNLVRQFPRGSTVCCMQDGAGIHHGTLVGNWLSQIQLRGISGRSVKFVKWSP